MAFNPLNPTTSPAWADRAPDEEQQEEEEAPDPSNLLSTPELVTLPAPFPEQVEGYHRLIEKIKEPNPPVSELYRRNSASLTHKLRYYLFHHPEKLNRMAEALVRMASEPGRNQLKAIQEIFDRIDGKATEHHIIEGETPMRLVFSPAPLPLDESPSQNTLLLEQSKPPAKQEV